METLTPPPETSYKRLGGFLLAFCAIAATYPLYAAALYAQSHEVIRDLQAGYSSDSSMTKFFKFVGFMGEGKTYSFIWVAFGTFLSRERYWHYLICMASGWLL